MHHVSLGVIWIVTKRPSELLGLYQKHVRGSASVVPRVPDAAIAVLFELVVAKLEDPFCMIRFLREDRSYSRPWRWTSSLPSPDRTKTLPPEFRRADRPWSNAVDRTWLQTNHQDTRKHRAALPPDLKLSDREPLPTKLFVPWS